MFRFARPALANWLNLTHNDFDELLPIATRATKTSLKQRDERAIFKLFSLGISTNRDEWLYDDDPAALASKAKFLTQKYAAQKVGQEFRGEIKWSRNLKRRHGQGRHEEFSAERVVRASYRPYYSPYLYDSELFVDEGGAKNEIFPLGAENRAICFSDVGSRTSYVALAVAGIADLHFGASIDAYQQVAQYRYEAGERLDNITDWALKQFTSHYKAGPGKRLPEPSKEGIFHYVYAVLHDPQYRETYAQNLKREFPRIPLHGTLRADFWRWAEWGRELMELHIGYEQVEPFALKRSDIPDEKVRAAAQAPKCMLKSEPAAGRIVIDSETTLAGIPPEAWDYRLGNRSAIDWVLDQHKEKKPKDPTIRAKFDTYRFADHKERVIELLARVVTVSVETLRIVAAMKEGPR